MDSLTAWFSSLPPAADFFPPSPEAYRVLISIFQYFPVVAFAQFFLPFQPPQGKSSLSTRILNFPGRYAWCFMESVGSINLIYTLLFSHNVPFAWSTAPFFLLPLWNQFLAVLYVLHYINRAVIMPLFVAPSISPIHAIVIGFAVAFNYMNSSVLAGWLLGYGTAPAGRDIPTGASSSSAAKIVGDIAPYIPYIGLALFLIGMQGNIQAETTLFRLRKDEAHRRTSSSNTTKDADKTQGQGNIYSKIYVIPPATGYFRFVLFPHYSLEWLEWTGFLLMGFAVVSPSAPAASTAAGPIHLAPYYSLVADILLNKLGLSFPFPAIMFLVNIVLPTMARATWGRKWYTERFGEQAVAGRTATIPYLL